jgi:hypothetical protein
MKRKKKTEDFTPRRTDVAPWTMDQARRHIGKFIMEGGCKYASPIAEVRAWDPWTWTVVLRGGVTISPKDLAECCTFYNGVPCGNVQHTDEKGQPL